MVIEWENGKNAIKAPNLQHLLAKIQNLKDKFGGIVFSHIYREMNIEAYTLSKQALDFQPRIMEIEEISSGHSTLYYE